MKSLMNKDSAKAHVDFLKNCGIPFILKVSNYTTEIKSDLGTTQFLQSMRGRQTFAAYQKVKSDVKKHPVPQIKKSEIRYFNHDFKNDYFSSEVLNIDIKSAYATVLYNEGIVSEKTFKYLSTVPKSDRLAAVGMLASKKYIFYYGSNGEIKNYEKAVSELENFFYFCVKKIDQLMTDLKKLCYSDYLFTWVDGIYLKMPNEETLSEMLEYLSKLSFQYSIEKLSDFSVEIINAKIKLSFIKEGEQKYFNIPAKDSALAVDIMNYLTNKNIENENNSFKVFRDRSVRLCGMDIYGKNRPDNFVLFQVRSLFNFGCNPSCY